MFSIYFYLYRSHFGSSTLATSDSIANFGSSYLRTIVSVDTSSVEGAARDTASVQYDRMALYPTYSYYFTDANVLDGYVCKLSVIRHIDRIAQENLLGFTRKMFIPCESQASVHGEGTSPSWLSCSTASLYESDPIHMHGYINHEYTLIVCGFQYPQGHIMHVPDAHFHDFPVIRGGVVSEGYLSDTRTLGPAFTMTNGKTHRDRHDMQVVFTFSPETMLKRARQAVLTTPAGPSFMVTLIIKLPPQMKCVSKDIYRLPRFLVPFLPRSEYKGLSTECKQLVKDSFAPELSSRDADNSIIVALVRMAMVQ